MKNPYSDLMKLVQELEEDMMKFFEKGNNAAGTRARKGLKDLKDRAQDIRMEIQNIKNSGN